MRTLRIIALSTLLILVPTETRGGGDPRVIDCERTLSTCERVVKAQHAAREADRKLIEKLTQQRDEATEAAAKASGGVSKEFVFVIGLVVGGLAVSLAR